MSTALQVEHEWPCPCDACGPIPAHDFSADEYRRRQIWKLMLVTEGQREEAELADIGRPVIWCIDCDKCSEPFQGTLESFGECLIDLGWEVDSLDRNTAICPACGDPQIELSEEEEREDFLLYEARGK